MLKRHGFSFGPIIFLFRSAGRGRNRGMLTLLSNCNGGEKGKKDLGAAGRSVEVRLRTVCFGDKRYGMKPDSIR